MRMLVLLTLTSCIGTGVVLPPSATVSQDPDSCWPYATGEVFEGSPIVRELRWSCYSSHQAGYSDDDETACDRSIVEVQTRCEGVPCDDITFESDGPKRNRGYRKISVTPRGYGFINIEYGLVHSSGLREFRRFHCAVEPRAQIAVGCLLRDPDTGVYSACPPAIKAGSELHATVAVAGAGDVELEIRNERGTVGAACPTAWREGDRVVRDCAWTARSGAFEIVGREGNLEARQSIAVID